MLIDDKVNNIIKPNIEINTDKNIFKINGIDLKLFCYWDIIFNNGNWFFTIKNKDEDNGNINISIGELKTILTNEGERGKELYQCNIDRESIVDAIGKRIAEHLKECIEQTR